jgi:hypothetical protein
LESAAGARMLLWGPFDNSTGTILANGGTVSIGDDGSFALPYATPQLG